MHRLPINTIKKGMATNPVKRRDLQTDWFNWERRRTINERKYRPRVARTLNGIVKEFTNELTSNGFDSALQKIDFYLRYTPLYKVLLRLYLEAGIREARATERELRKKGLGNAPEYIAAIQAYFRRYLLDKSVIPIVDTLKDKVRAIMELGLSEGWGAEKTAREIISKMNEFTKIQSRRIVRTETVRAANFTKLEAAKKNRFETAKIWITARDERVRGNPTGRYPADKPYKPNHWELHEKELPGLDDEFENGCSFPGDPRAAAKEVINCRCTLVFRTKKDSQGNPIPKRTILPSLLTSFAEGFIRGLTITTLIDQIVNE